MRFQGLGFQGVKVEGLKVVTAWDLGFRISLRDLGVRAWLRDPKLPHIEGWAGHIRSRACWVCHLCC